MNVDMNNHLSALNKIVKVYLYEYVPTINCQDFWHLLLYVNKLNIFRATYIYLLQLLER